LTGLIVGAAPIKSISEIRALAPEDAARQHAVVVEATVTFRDPAHSAFVAYDGEEGIYVALPKERGGDVRTGARVRIEGHTQPGGFLPVIESQQVVILGQEHLSTPRRLEIGELFSPALDCQWVEFPAVITGVEKREGLVFIAEVSGWTVKLLLPEQAHTREEISGIMQRPVTVQGVVGSIFNSQRQLTGRHFFVPALDRIIPSEFGRPVGAPELRTVATVLRSDATAGTGVRLRGVITHAATDGLYLRGEGGSIFVRTSDPDDFAPGSYVLVEGFASVAPFRPILRATSVKTLHRSGPPEPVQLDLAGGKLERQQAELVSVEANFLARRDAAAGGVVLQCRAGNWFFEAETREASGFPASLREGDRLRLVGLCELMTSQVLPFGKNADGFRLHLRGAGDVSIIRRASWWTPRRLLAAFGLMAGLALVTLSWVVLLRRRVAEQTRIIGAQIERAAVKDERQRIARELHDTVEQELAGLSIQLRNARHRLDGSPAEASTALKLAERMLRHCREEARTSIQDLRSVALEQRGLRGALAEFLAPLAAECGAQYRLDVEGEPRSLQAVVELHLLRIAHEAAANAARHADARFIQVRIIYEAARVTIEIQDDGRGFDPGAPAPRGHFGLTGMRERSNKIQGSITIESAPGAGTTVRVSVPNLTAHGPRT
jgi:signal transduction histidine kinase